MTTDKDSMIQEVRDPRASTDATKPSEHTTQDTMKAPVTNTMVGDIESASAHLKKIIAFLEAQDPQNDDMIARAKKIRDHYNTSGEISQEQFEWIEAVVFPETDPDVSGVDPDAEPAPAFTDPEEVKRIVAARKQAIKDQIAQAAPPTDVQKIIVTPDMPPSGEEAVETSSETEVFEEPPADQPLSEDAVEEPK